MEEIRKDLGIDNLSVTRSGRFFRKGKELKVLYCTDRAKGRKCTARICPMTNGKVQYYQAAKLVAKAFLPEWTEDSCIIYRDGDCHNIKVENLKVTDWKGYQNYMRRNSGHKADDMDKRIEKLNRVIKEASLTRDFFLTRDFSDINKHIEDVLLPIMNDYCRRTLCLGISTTMRIVPEAIARMYEVIDNDMCLYNYERWLKKILLNYKKKGNFGVAGCVPKPIHTQEVSQLKLECLSEKWNVKKQRH